MNKQTGQWGAVYNPADDVGRVEMRLTVAPNHVEVLTVVAPSMADYRGSIDFTWGPSTASESFTASTR